MTTLPTVCIYGKIRLRMLVHLNQGNFFLNSLMDLHWNCSRCEADLLDLWALPETLFSVPRIHRCALGLTLCASSLRTLKTLKISFNNNQNLFHAMLGIVYDNSSLFIGWFQMDWRPLYLAHTKDFMPIKKSIYVMEFWTMIRITTPTLFQLMGMMFSPCARNKRHKLYFTISTCKISHVKVAFHIFHITLTNFSVISEYQMAQILQLLQLLHILTNGHEVYNIWQAQMFSVPFKNQLISLSGVVKISNSGPNTSKYWLPCLWLCLEFQIFYW